MADHDPLKHAETTWRGRSGKPDPKPTLEKAIEDAWTKRPTGTVAMRVVDIYVAGNNPISEYSVIVAPG